jgi:hypothetical protein
MNIASKLTVGLVSIAFVASATVGLSTTVHADEISDLQEQLRALTSQLATLQDSPSAAVASSNAACPYTWARNLTTGSTGEDVRQLQRFLNGNPQTQVASSGVGSPGNESTYYGPATARAVSKFQELYAAQILTPLGLTRGTGGFYTSTRNQANSACSTASSTPPVSGATNNPVLPQAPHVSGDALAVSAGQHPADSYAVKGAQRVPFTAFVLTAGNDDVRIDGITVRRTGLSSSDNFESVALVDVNGVQIGESRSLGSDDEATLGGNFEIPRNRSVTLAVVGNISNVDNDIDSGAVAGLEVTSVEADASVSGNFPIRGAAHVLSESVDLQTVSVEVKSSESEIEFDKDTEVVVVELDLTGSNVDEEDAYLRSLTLEQSGSADEDEVGDVTVFVDDEEVDYRITVDGDRYVITFGGQGVLIEENDSIDVSLEVNTDEGTGEEVNFYVDDVADVYVVGRDYGYGLPVDLRQDDGGKGNSKAVIQSGDISTGRVSDFDDEISYGDNKVIGALEIEFEGEDIEIEDLTFRVTFDYDYSVSGGVITSGWASADEDDISLRGLHLRIDGNRVAFADDDVEFTDTEAGDAFTDRGQSFLEEIIDFSDTFTVDVRDERDVVFEIVADLDDAWSHFDGADLTFELIDVDSAEGVRSDEDYTDDEGEVFNVASNDPLDFEGVTIKGNEVEFEVTNEGVDEDSYVAGAEDIVFGSIIIDADDTGDDVEVTSAYLTFEASGSNSGSNGGSVYATLRDVDDCAIYDSRDDKVADSRGSLSGTAEDGERAKDQIRFTFDDFTVEAGSEVTVEVRCDIDDDALSGHNYRLAADTSEEDRIEYEIGRDDFDYFLESGDSSETIAVAASGTLTVTTDNPDEDNTVVAVATTTSSGSTVEVLEIELEAEQEDIQIKDIWISGLDFGAGNVTLNKDSLDDFISSARLVLDGTTTTARPNDFDASRTINGVSVTDGIEFEDINVTIENNVETVATVSFVLEGIDENSDSKAGQYLTATHIVVTWEGEDSDTETTTEYSIGAGGGDLTTAVVFPNVPTVTAAQKDQNLSNGNNRKIYEFKVANSSSDDVYLGRTSFSVSHNVTLANLKVSRGSSCGGTTLTNTIGSVAADNSTARQLDFTEVEEISRSDTNTYSVCADITNVEDDDSITVEILADADASSSPLGQNFASLGSANFVWSPNALENDGKIINNDGETINNEDWFSGWSVFDQDDVFDWVSEK